MKVNIHIEIVPFGTSRLKMVGQMEQEAVIETAPFYYAEPETTNVAIFEYDYETEKFNTPKSTAGVF